MPCSILGDRGHATERTFDYERSPRPSLARPGPRFLLAVPLVPTACRHNGLTASFVAHRLLLALVLPTGRGLMHTEASSSDPHHMSGLGLIN